MTNLTAADFAKQPRGAQSFDFWLARVQLETPLGNFDIELREPPNEESVRAASESQAVLISRSEELLNQLFASYEQAAENKSHMRSCRVPRNLERDEVTRYLRNRTMTIRRDGKGRVSVTVDITPKWDIEHGLCWIVVGQRLVRQPT